MQTRKPLLTRHRRQKLVLWLLAMLQWVAGVLFAGACVTERAWRQRSAIPITWLKRLTENLLIVRAGELSPSRRRPPRFCKHGRSLRPRHLMRSLLGARLRRVLRHKDLRAQIGALIAVLRNLDHYAQLLAHRLRRRLTRLWPIAPAPMRAARLFATSASTPAIADSS